MLIEILARQSLKTYNTSSGRRFIPDSDVIYQKVNKRKVHNLAMVGSFKGGSLSVSWIDTYSGERYVRFYRSPYIHFTYNKNRTKERIQILGKYERTVIEHDK